MNGSPFPQSRPNVSTASNKRMRGVRDPDINPLFESLSQPRFPSTGISATSISSTDLPLKSPSIPIDVDPQAPLTPPDEISPASTFSVDPLISMNHDHPLPSKRFLPQLNETPVLESSAKWEHASPSVGILPTDFIQPPKAPYCDQPSNPDLGTRLTLEMNFSALKWELGLLRNHLSECDPIKLRQYQDEAIKYARQLMVRVIFRCFSCIVKKIPLSAATI